VRNRRSSRQGARFSPGPLILLVVLGLSLVALAYVAVRMLLAGRPAITVSAPFEVVGRNSTLLVDVQDKHGLKAARVTVRQGDQDHVVLDRTYAPPRPSDQLRWQPAQEKAFKLQEGPGKVTVWARNDSWGDFLRGRVATLEKDFTVRLVPPRVEVQTTQHYVSQGGCDTVVYKVTPAGVASGVQVGEHFFRGFPVPGASDPALHFAIFCLPYDAKPGTPVRVSARDEADNQSLVGFWLKVFPKAFRTRDLPLDDTFMNKVVPEIMSQTPSLTDQGDLLKNYLQINRDLRKANNGELARLAASSHQGFLWSEPFQQLGNSQVEAQFADTRRYIYNGQAVDQQTHLGFDLATTAHAPVTAANDGTVVVAEFFGIYGNAVVIDHGYGLMSLYGHLSTFDVKKGESVKRGQTIAHSGATGLAAGDHLHFSMLYQDVQVDPREWWDAHWIHDRLAVKLAQFGSGTGPGRMVKAASPGAGPGAASPAAPR